MAEKARRRRRGKGPALRTPHPGGRGWPPARDALSSDEDEVPAGKLREIPGYYYDEVAKAYFAVPRGGCTVSTQAKLRAEKRAQIHKEEQEGEEREVAARRAARGAIGRLTGGHRGGWGGMVTALKRREQGSKMSPRAMEWLRVMKGSCRDIALRWNIQVLATASVRALRMAQDPDWSRFAPRTDGYSGWHGVGLAARGRLVATCGYEGFGVVILGDCAPDTGHRSAGASGEFPREPRTDTVEWIPTDEGCSCVAFAPVSQGPRHQPLLHGSERDGGIHPLLAVAFLGGAGTPPSLSVYRLPEEPAPAAPYEPRTRKICSFDLGSKGSARACAWTEDGRGLAVGCDKRVHVVPDLEPGGVGRCVRASSDVTAQRFFHGSHGGSLLVNGCRDGSAWLYDVRAAERRLPSLQHERAVCGLHTLSDGCSLVASSVGGGLVRWDLRSPSQPVLRYPGHANAHRFVGVAVDACEGLLWAGGGDGVVRCWGAASGVLLKEVDMGCDEDAAQVCAIPGEAGGGGRGAAWSEGGLVLASTPRRPLVLVSSALE